MSIRTLRSVFAGWRSSTCRAQSADFNEDRSMVLVINGEIYNYQSIRADLLQKGHVFSTETDSEVLLHGYEGVRRKRPVGTSCGACMRFVIWDKKEKKLFGARDIFGIKPFITIKKATPSFSAAKSNPSLNIRGLKKS